MVHRFEIRPIFGDVDAMGWVYYGNYLRYFERGRAELMRSSGRTYAQLAEAGMHMPVIEAHLKYRRPARYDQLIIIETTVSWVKRASLRFDYRILDSEDESELIAGYTIHGCVNLTGKVVAMPDWLVKVAETYAQSPD